MIYDHRTYVCRPGTIRKHLALYQEFGWPVQQRVLGTCLLYAQVETGDVNSFVHIWVYRDAADRAERRRQLANDPEWQAYLKKSAEAGYLVEQRNSLLTEAPFFEVASEG